MFLQIDGYITGVTTQQDFWTGGGTYPFQSAAVALEIVSASANDAAAGTGARTVHVGGLDVDYQAVDQEVTLNGTTPVALATPLFRVNEAHVRSAGSGGQNAGNLTIRLAGAGASQGIILAGRNRLQQAIYTVPMGNIYEITDIVYSVVAAQSQGNTVGVFGRFVRDPGGVFYRGLEQSVSDMQTLPIQGIRTPLFLPAGTDLKYSAQASSASTMAVTLRGVLH